MILTKKQKELLSEIEKNGTIATGKFGEFNIRTLNALFVKGLIGIKGGWCTDYDSHQHEWHCCLAEYASGDYIADTKKVHLQISCSVDIDFEYVKQLVLESGFTGKVVVSETYDIEELVHSHIMIGGNWSIYKVPQNIMDVLIANSSYGMQVVDRLHN